MSLQTFLLWAFVGLVAGWLASVVVKGGSMGVLGDIVVGIVGAFLGGLVLRTRAPHGWAGLPWTIFVAFVGAVVLLLVIRLIRRGLPPREPPHG